MQDAPLYSRDGKCTCWRAASEAGCIMQADSSALDLHAPSWLVPLAILLLQALPTIWVLVRCCGLHCTVATLPLPVAFAESRPWSLEFCARHNDDCVQAQLGAGTRDKLESRMATGTLVRRAPCPYWMSCWVKTRRPVGHCRPAAGTAGCTAARAAATSSCKRSRSSLAAPPPAASPRCRRLRSCASTSRSWAPAASPRRTSSCTAATGLTAGLARRS
jgi:hypothetical protein